jgi:lauroyl/myristoyl acyltransferase
MHFRPVKDVIALPLHRFGFFVAGLPETLGRAIMASIGAVARASYFAPGSYVRRTVGNFCRATGRSDPWPIYCRMVDNLERAALHYASLYRYGRSKLLAQTDVDPTLAKEYPRLGNGDDGIIFLVPHCAGSVLASAGLSTFCPTVLLVREPKAPVRCQLMLEYLKRLGPQFILSRTASPATVMRGIVRSLHDREVVVGTTDVIRPGPDTAEAWAFGQRIHSPVWPARIAARLGVPILPAFIHMEGPRLSLIAGEGYRESDIQKSTQRWVTAFEQFFRQYPSDWAFMLDKHWARVFAAASAPDDNGKSDVASREHRKPAERASGVQTSAQMVGAAFA